MSFSVFTDNNARAGRTYSTAKLAQQEADARNRKAEMLGLIARYQVQPYIPNSAEREKIREIYHPIS